MSCLTNSNVFYRSIWSEFTQFCCRWNESTAQFFEQLVWLPFFQWHESPIVFGGWKGSTHLKARAIRFGSDHTVLSFETLKNNPFKDERFEVTNSRFPQHHLLCPTQALQICPYLKLGLGADTPYLLVWRKKSCFFLLRQVQQVTAYHPIHHQCMHEHDIHTFVSEGRNDICRLTECAARCIEHRGTEGVNVLGDTLQLIIPSNLRLPRH